MTVYNNIVSFGGVYFRYSSITSSEKPSTLKSNIGKTLIERDIPLRNTKDIVLNVSGVIEGLSKTSAQSISTAIENDRTALNNLNDGYKHSYIDGKHSGNFVIQPNTLIWDDDVNQVSGQPNKFSMTIIQWQ